MACRQYVWSMWCVSVCVFGGGDLKAWNRGEYAYTYTPTHMCIPPQFLELGLGLHLLPFAALPTAAQALRILQLTHLTRIHRFKRL